MAQVIKNALASVAAMLCKHDATASNTDGPPLTAMSKSELEHLHGYQGSLIADHYSSNLREMGVQSLRKSV